MQSAPVAEPPRAPARPVAPAKENGHSRPARSVKPRGGRKAPGLPSLPPAAHAPARLAPLVYFIAQTLLDMVAIAAAYGLSYRLRFDLDILRKFVAPDEPTYGKMLGVTVATIIVTFYFSKLYNLRRGASRVDEFYRIAAAVSMGTVLSLATNSLILADKFVYSRQILLMGWLLAIIFVTVLRLAFGVAVGQLRKSGIDRRRVIVVGTGPTAGMVIDRLEYHKSLGYQVLGVLVEEGEGGEPGPYVQPKQVLGDVSHLREIVRRYDADEVILALSGASDRQLRDIIALLQDESVSTKVYPDAFQLVTDYEVSVGELSGLPLLSVKDVALRGWNRILKRAFDVVFSAVVLILTAPLLLLLAALVKLSGPGPVFFIQERVGLDNKPFPLVKFRTMRVSSDSTNGAEIDNTPGWTVPNDPRRTRIGTFLRRFSLDELPQFYNVLVGEMSVVGPRPEQPHYVQEIAQKLPQYLRRHREKAGITGWAQVNGFRGHTPIELRTAADLYYVENWSLLFDLKIIARTVWAMIWPKNAY